VPKNPAFKKRPGSGRLQGECEEAQTTKQGDNATLQTLAESRLNHVKHIIRVRPVRIHENSKPRASWVEGKSGLFNDTPIDVNFSSKQISKEDA
jgi:hypothetical protein